MAIDEEKRMEAREKWKRFSILTKMRRIKGFAREVKKDPDGAIAKYAKKFGISKDVLRELALDNTDKLVKNPVVARMLKIPKEERTDEKIAEARAKLVKDKKWKSELEKKREYEIDKKIKSLKEKQA